MKFSVGFFWGLALLFSCRETQARKPVSVSSSSSLKASIDRNKLILEREMAYFKEIIEEDSLQGFENSTNGFIYKYVHRHPEADSLSEGDQIKVTYDVRHPDGRIIYSKAENGILSLKYNKEAAFFPGMRDALGMMREGDTLQAFFPSSLAYGYHGDNRLIRSNRPIFCEIVLLDIEKNNQQNQ